MNEIAAQAGQEITPAARGINDVTRDIWTRARNLVQEAVEIGRLLYEAKAMVPSGEWGRYVAEKLPFSHSWANNYMRLYKELGQDQTSLFVDSQAFANLSVTQALELLTLPAEERDAFIRDNDVESMSTRELHQAIRERDEARQAAADAAKAAETAEAEYRMRLDQAESLAKTAAALRSDLEKAEKAVQKARDSEAAAKRELDNLRKNPKVPESTMAQLRKEAEVAAAKKAAADMQKKLDAANAAAQNAAAKQAEAEKAAKEAKDKLDVAQRAQKINDPNLQAVQILSQQLMETAAKLVGHCRCAIDTSADNGPKLAAFLQRLQDQLAEGFQEVR